MDNPILSLSLSLGDLLPTLITPPDDSPSDTVTQPPAVTVTVTVPDTSTSSSTSSSSSLVSTPSTAHSTSSNATIAAPSSTVPNSSGTNTGDFITTTYLTYEGTSLLTVTAVVSNPAARMHDNVGSSAFFNNRTAVIGVFTAVGIVIFAALFALLAWIARRRKLKRLRQEAAEKASSSGHRNFFDDEMNDVVAPSEKSWWGNTSGTSIPDSSMPMLLVNSPYNNAPAVPSSVGHSENTPVSEITASIAHPYASAPQSVVSDSYQSSTVTHGRANSATTMTTVTSPSGEFSRSPPLAMSLPPVPNRLGQGGHLPQIDEVPPSHSSNEWNSAPSGPALSQDKGHPVHPYASPPTNRKSTLYPEDVLYNLGSGGGVGRSLSGRILSGREQAPSVTIQPQESVLGITQGLNMMQPSSTPMQNNPSQYPTSMPTGALPPLPQLHVQRPMDERVSPSPENLSSLGHQIPAPRTRTAPIQDYKGDNNASRFRSRDERPVSGTGLFDGGWYEDEVSSDAGRAAASGESVLGGSAAHNVDFGYPRIGSASDVNISASGEGSNGNHRGRVSPPSATDVQEQKTRLHDPRFSGLFGSGWVSSGDESRLGSTPNGTRISSARGSTDHGTFDDHYYDGGRYGGNGNRVLRVTNE